LERAIIDVHFVSQWLEPIQALRPAAGVPGKQ
jgi:hypothetical protein